MRKILADSFFNRPVLEVAPDLLGKYLVRKIKGKEEEYLINETEAYDGVRDKACKASRGRTPGCEPMFGSAGYWYVYFTYGMHFMLNIVTSPKEYPAAVLIRGAGAIVGPGRLTKSLAISKSLNMKKAEERSGLWIEDRGMKVQKSDIIRTPRIGIDSAGPYWAKKPYRFVIKTKTAHPRLTRVRTSR